jgi:hypothetical protein
MKMFTRQKKVTAGSAIQFLLNYFQESVSVFRKDRWQVLVNAVMNLRVP